MEKLIVKNFGPIKEAEIDLTKYVVFIGDTSTGKSVLAKLIAIFRDFNFTNYSTIDVFKSKLTSFGINFLTSGSSIIYTSNVYSWTVADNSLETDYILKGVFNSFERNYNSAFSNTTYIMNNFENILTSIKKSKLLNNDGVEIQQIKRVVENPTLHNNDSFASALGLSRILLELYNYVGKNFDFNFNSSIYFPTERNLVSIASGSLGGLYANNVALPQSFKDFFSLFEVSRKEIQKFKITGFNINYEYRNDRNIVQSDNYEISLDIASSGIQSVIPLFVVLENITQEKNHFDNTLIIEEPELNLFPIKQKKIIETIICKTKHRGDRLVITTHSPYILSVLDTLILAKNTFNEHPDLKEEINEIVSEDKWIDYNDISVYEVRNDGTMRSIKNEEFKSIDTNAIDGVSDIISEEFDKLTELRYAQ